MKKGERGILTVEASIVLTLCTFFILFLFSFVRVYSAQSLVSHAVLQSSDAVALESYLREQAYSGKEAQIVELANRLNGSGVVSGDSFTSLRSADLPKVAKEKFVYAISDTETAADRKLKTLGVKDGLSGVDFSASRIDLGNDDVIVYARYTIEMQFPIFGFKEIEVSKAAKSKTFGGIMFGIEVVPEDPYMGTTAGGGSYKFGTEVQISATPSYGYVFKKWADGSTENPRTITVAGYAKYVAIFEPSAFGVNVAVDPSNSGTVSGGGLYSYKESATVTATAAEGYHFTRWSIYKHKDKSTDVSYSPTVSLTVDQTYTCTAWFEANTYTVRVRTEGAADGLGFIVFNGTNTSSISVKYKSAFTLYAPEVEGYRFVGWREEGASNYFSTSQSVPLTVPPRDVTYVACYESAVKTVRFYDYDGQLYAVRSVNAGSSLGGDMPEDPKKIGRVFNGWTDGFSGSTRVYSDMEVQSQWRTCTTHRRGDCGEIHEIKAVHLNGHSGGKNEKKTYLASCVVCADCGCFLKNGRPANIKKWTNSKGGAIYLAPNLWCIAHKNPNGRCESYMKKNSCGTYRIHDN